ncbi:MAG TPA: hypothetical protein VGQ99_13360 [Tepidisphaeraceae bacterium]|jgi:hypothetical protein|nr:hypothetical protein [Tepidisphaeraceae bacterium]
MKQSVFFAVCFSVLFLHLHPCQASELYAVDTAGVGPLSNLYRLNQSTGADAFIGSTGLPLIYDLTSDTRAASVMMWGNDISTQQLLKIDPTTGIGTPVGVFRLVSPITVASLAFDAKSGNLYGTVMRGLGFPADALARIDPNTAAVTPVGNSSIQFDHIHALAFDNSGQLFGISQDNHQLIQIDTPTGIGTAIAPVSLNAIYDIATRPEDGVTFAVDSETHHLYTLDLSTGLTTDLGPYQDGLNFQGLAFISIPEPSSAILLISALVLPLRGRGYPRFYRKEKAPDFGRGRLKMTLRIFFPHLLIPSPQISGNTAISTLFLIATGSYITRVSCSNH